MNQWETDSSTGGEMKYVYEREVSYSDVGPDFLCRLPEMGRMESVNLSV